jgi:pSer/pThr/pTyr-binding forkhead associated (FHA) protein
VLPEDVPDLARRLTREEFVARMPELILVGDEAFTKQPSLLKTASMQVIDWNEPTAVRNALLHDKPPGRLVLPLRKVQKIFPNMVTVGRALNNDLVILDEAVSKLHAYFTRLGSTTVSTATGPTRLGLVDAGSTNGTWINDQRLATEATPVEIKAGMRLKFAHLQFTAMPSGTYWDRARG